MVDAYVDAKVTQIKKIGQGTRVCLDFIDVLAADEGVCVGNTGHGYVTVLSENRQTDTYPPRPFRVNVGAHHQYVKGLSQATHYATEIKPGDVIPIYSLNGEREVSVGRVKKEKRDFFWIEAETENQAVVSTTLQQADSVHLLTPNGPVNVLDLTIGATICVVLDTAGRHLGQQIDEAIEEQ
ncbi:3-dehydroquinate synthase family protein [Streptohalobacillus salinus]|uniref:3-dehydroquinate synthase family protein n=1 Tax=Streptohalobacillus salinus TaxID=621096 RepID=A0A2V3WC37_9BACI|nr:3-dehydroquinate synthase II [Streptohalobacillus salinus]PXW92129.1 3-dehydroquinate synthase family protein [Streptohalobacillus salinus]